MELLIVLGLCFGAYELLGVFQGCFTYNEHPLPYQPHQHFPELKEDGEEQQTHQEQEQRQSTCDESVDDTLDSIKSCSCYDDIFDDDTITILNDARKRQQEQKQLPAKRFVFDKPISKFTLSSSLLSLNRDDQNIFNYIDDINNNKFYKFKEENDDDDDDNSSINSISNDKTSDKTSSNNIENDNENSSTMNNVQINNKKIFLISSAAT